MYKKNHNTVAVGGHPNLTHCPSVPVSQCHGVLLSHCPDVSVSQCPSIPVSLCPGVIVSQYPSVPVTFGGQRNTQGGGRETHKGGTEKRIFFGIDRRTHKCSYRGAAHLKILSDNFVHHSILKFVWLICLYLYIWLESTRKYIPISRTSSNHVKSRDSPGLIF